MRRGIAIGVAVMAVVAVAASWASNRPLWSYHNITTLGTKSENYREGFTIGVIDGYFAAHRALARAGDSPNWLDSCLSRGWTARRAVAEVAGELAAATGNGRHDAAGEILGALRERCRR